MDMVTETPTPAAGPASPGGPVGGPGGPSRARSTTGGVRAAWARWARPWRRSSLSVGRPWSAPPWLASLLVAGLVTVLNWPHWGSVQPGLDISWQAGTAYAFVHHLQWGPQLDFTYGPYGFAGFLLPFYPSTAAVSFGYLLGVTWLLSALVVTGLRRYWGLPGAGLAAWALVGLTWAVGRSADVAPAAGLGLGLLLVRGQDRPRRLWLAGVLGALAGFSVLVKLSDGVVLAAVGALAVLGSELSWRERGMTAVSLVIAAGSTFVAAWWAAGQSIGHLWSFARASLSLTLGYSANMAGPLARPSAAWWAVVVVLVLAGLSALGLTRQGRRARVAGALMVGGWCWAVAKDGFVMGNHYPGFFRLVLAVTAVVSLLGPPRRALVGALAVVAVVVMAMTPVPRPNPVGSARAFAGELVDLASPSRFASLQAQARRRVLRGEGVGRLAALLSGHTMAVEPWEDIIAWALPGAKWDPEPVLQSYSAFTSYTDRLDAGFLSSGAAPQRLLYWHHRFGFAGRDPDMDPPATTVAVYCHYVQLAVAGRWQVLQRVPDRCGAPRTLARVRVRFGVPVRAPRARGGLLLASFALAPTLLDRAEALVLRPPLTYLVTWGRRGPGSGGTAYTFVTGTAAGPHVLGAPAQLGFSPHFTPATVGWLELKGDGYATGRGWVTVTFSTLRIAAR